MRLLLALLISTPFTLVHVHAQVAPLRQDLERTLTLPPDRAYSKFDTNDYEDAELAASAVAPFCKSFTFLCHLRCLQRTNDAPVLPNTPGDPRAEISRCNVASSMSDSSLKVLCLCSNGVDLTAEVSYALEGVVDIRAAGGEPEGTSGEGEAGQIRSVAYVTVTTTTTEIRTRAVTETVTQVVNTCLPVAGGQQRGAGVQGGSGVAPVVVPDMEDEVEDDDGKGGGEQEGQGGDSLDGVKIWDSEVADAELDALMDDEDKDLYLGYDANYQDDDMDQVDTGSDQVDELEYDLTGQDKDSKVREDL